MENPHTTHTSSMSEAVNVFLHISVTCNHAHLWCHLTNWMRMFVPFSQTLTQWFQTSRWSWAAVSVEKWNARLDLSLYVIIFWFHSKSSKLTFWTRIRPGQCTAGGHKWPNGLKHEITFFAFILIQMSVWEWKARSNDEILFSQFKVIRWQKYRKSKFC